MESLRLKLTHLKEENYFPADYFISTMPVRELIAGMGAVVPDDVQSVAEGLIYRDFITVGLLLRELKLKNNRRTKTLNTYCAG